MRRWQRTRAESVDARWMVTVEQGEIHAFLSVAQTELRKLKQLSSGLLSGQAVEIEADARLLLEFNSLGLDFEDARDLFFFETLSQSLHFRLPGGTGLHGPQLLAAIEAKSRHCASVF